MTEFAFINYRREDSASEARLIADALAQSTAASVFMDSESIESGETWPDRIRSAVAASRFVLVVIGPDWLTAGTNDWGQRRIDNEEDWVRQEIKNALSDPGKTIIPLLVRGAKMPPPDALPDCICGVASRQAIEVRRDYWDHDIKLLINRFGSQEAVSDSTAETNPLVSDFWDNLSPGLQDAFLLAANAARREGKDIISTRTLFAALRRLHPAPLPEFFQQIPPEAMPDPLPSDLSTDSEALSGIRLFSGCVQDSLNHLTPQSGPSDRLTAENMFVDIARHGTGASVRRLRTHGIGVDRINGLVEQLGWTVADRNTGTQI